MISSILTGYTDRLSCEPGATISVHLSSPEPATADVSLVRLTHSIDPSNTPEAIAGTVVEWRDAGRYELEPQEGRYGSFVVSDVAAAPADAITIGLFVRLSAKPAEGASVLMELAGSRNRFTLGLDSGRPFVQVDGSDDDRAVLELPIDSFSWTLVIATIRDSGQVTLAALPVNPSYDGGQHTALNGAAIVMDNRYVAAIGAGSPRDVEDRGTVVIGRAERNFTGKIARPFVSGSVIGESEIAELLSARSPADVLRGSFVATWDFSPTRDANSPQVHTRGTHHPAYSVVNLPTRCVTGPFWDGEERFTDYPSHFDAIHFHDDDVVDAGWPETLRATLPDDLPSGLYGFRVTTASGSDTIPFAVTPRRTGPKKQIAVVLPTFTYIAYANESLFEHIQPDLTGATTNINDRDRAHLGNKTFGLGFYHTHSDGSGVTLSASARPIANMRHDYNMWLSDGGRGLSGDMYLLQWLHEEGYEVDILTDLELHQDGPAWLESYSTVITGGHPEYHSEQILNAFEHYRDHGGKIMYLGGNGFYWVTGVVTTEPLTLELRRGVAGVAEWKNEPGELYMSTTRQRGGLWRFRGRPPQKLVGVGFSAMGWGHSAAFERTEESHDSRFSWVFDGIDEERLGDVGLVMGGAAGDEIDRADFSLGTPPQTTVLARSVGHDQRYQRAIEEVAYILPGQHGGDIDSDVRADIVYFDVPGGGAVFSAGSIAYSGALLPNGRDNAISTLTRNVLERFLNPPA